MRCELSLQPLSTIQPFPESRPLLEAVQAGSNVWDEGAYPPVSLGCKPQVQFLRSQWYFLKLPLALVSPMWAAVAGREA